MYTIMVMLIGLSLAVKMDVMSYISLVIDITTTNI